MHKFLLWLYKICCCNHASGGRSGWPWAWREPPVSLQGPVHAHSNVVSASDYFHTDNYEVLTRRTECHNKISFVQKVKTVLIFKVNLSHFMGIVLWTTAMWIDGWQNLKREECPAPTCRAQGDRAHLARMPTKTCWKSHSEWPPIYRRGYLCSYGPNSWDSDENH